MIIFSFSNLLFSRLPISGKVRVVHYLILFTVNAIDSFAGLFELGVRPLVEMWCGRLLKDSGILKMVQCDVGSLYVRVPLRSHSAGPGVRYLVLVSRRIALGSVSSLLLKDFVIGWTVRRFSLFYISWIYEKKESWVDYSSDMYLVDPKLIYFHPLSFTPWEKRISFQMKVESRWLFPRCSERHIEWLRLCYAAAVEVGRSWGRLNRRSGSSADRRPGPSKARIGINY